LFQGDSPQAWIRESGGTFSDRFTVTLADGTETMLDWARDEQRYTITYAGRLAASVNVCDRWFRRQKYALELSPEADPILTIATCVVIDRARSQRHLQA
jgi:uncharacterized protein YxjI